MDRQERWRKESRATGAPAMSEPTSQTLYPYETDALILGQALHGAWNEGTRVNTYNFARVASSLRRTHVVSVTEPTVAGLEPEGLPIEHVYTNSGIGAGASWDASWRLMQRARAISMARPIGVVHVFQQPIALASWLRQCGGRIVIHVVLTQHAYMKAWQRVRTEVAYRCFDRWVDAYVASSASLVRSIVARGVPEEKVRVIPAPVDTSLYHPGDRNEARWRLALQTDDFIVVYVGVLSPIRFPAAVVGEALYKAASQSRRKVRLCAFTPDAMHDYSREWSKVIEQQLTRIPNVSVEIVRQDMSAADKIAWFHAADAVLLPFARPTSVEPALTLLESMACGSLVLATTAANQSQLIEAQHNGLLYATPEELSTQLVRVSHDADGAWLDSLRRAARATVVERHSFKTAAEAAVQLWARLEKTVSSSPVSRDGVGRLYDSVADYGG